MNNVEPTVSPLRNLRTSFREVFLEVCHKGYSVLGRTPASSPTQLNPWQYSHGHPPSLTPMYYGLDKLTKNLGMKASSKFCTQMIVLAKND